MTNRDQLRKEYHLECEKKTNHHLKQLWDRKCPPIGMSRQVGVKIFRAAA